MTEPEPEDENTSGPDAFVSHSSQDKARFVRPLVECLSEQGLDLWYDEYAMQPGDSLSASIDHGLAQAGAGVVVISPAFIETARESGWTHYELRGIVANSMGPDGRRLVPIWLDVSREDVLQWSPPMADLIAVDASGKSIEEVALALLRVLAPDLAGGLSRMRLLAAARGKGRVELASIDDLEPSPAQDRRVPGSVPLRAALVTAALADCGVEFASDLSTFLENLSRDLHHEGELRLWEVIAGSYASATQAFDLSSDQKEALYRLLLGASFGLADEDAITALSPEVAGPIVDYFHELLPLTHTDAVIGEGGLKGYIPLATETIDNKPPEATSEEN